MLTGEKFKAAMSNRSVLLGLKLSYSLHEGAYRMTCVVVSKLQFSSSY